MRVLFLLLACVPCCLFAQGGYAQTQELPPAPPNGMMPTIMASPPPFAGKPPSQDAALPALPDAAGKEQKKSTDVLEAQKRSEKIKRLLDIQIKHSKEAEALMSTEQALLDERKKQLDEQEKQQERYKAILDKWEAQQEQYQKYLDSLTQPKQEPKK